MAALTGLIPVAHGGTVGLVIEIGTAVALTVLMAWAVWKSHRQSHQNDEDRPGERSS